jgi:folate-binding protein YgfZ
MREGATVSTTSPLHATAAGAGASFREEAGWLMPARYGDPAAEYRQARERAALFDVSHRGKVEVSGADARTFLHNLCSNDVQGLAAGSGCEAFLLTAQARVVAYPVIYRLPEGVGDGCWLDLDPGQAEKVVRHLDHYLISERVELADRTREYAQLHLAGPQSQDVLQRALKAPVAPLQDLQLLVHRLDAGPLQIRACRPLGVAGYDLVCPAGCAEGVWQLLTSGGARPAGLEAYEILRIEAGTPVYGVDVDEGHLAPEVGRTRQAISYSKGCYLGQEPVVRVRDLGHVNRVLLGLKGAGAEPLPRGARLRRDGAEAGHVTSSAFSPSLGAVVALAYVRRGSQEPGTRLTAETEAGGRAVEVSALPFVA